MKKNNKPQFIEAFLFTLTTIVIFFSCNSSGTNSSQNDTTSNISMDSARYLNESKFDTSKGEVNNSQFLLNAYSSGLFEIKASEAALSRTNDKRIKDLAQSLIKTYNKLNKQISNLANQRQISLPANITKDQANNLSILEKEKGPVFDEAYVRQIIHDNKDMLVLLNNAQKSSDPEMINWAKSTLPLVQQTLDNAGISYKMLDSLERKIPY